MRVLQLISTIGYYGAESVVCGLSRESHRLGHGTVVSTLTRKDRHSGTIVEKAQGAGIPAFDFPCSGRIDFSVLRSLRALIREQRIELIHSHNYKSNIYAYLAALGKKIPLVSTCHNWTVATRSLRIYASIDQSLLRAFDKVIAVSDKVAGQLRLAGLPDSRVSVIANGIEIQEFETARPSVPAPAPGEITIGTACRMVPEKGIPDLLYSFAALLDRFPNIRLIIAGDGPNRQEFETIARKLGISGRVSFLGFQNDMPAIYASMSILEAMAAGKPVIATSVGAVPKVVTENVGVLIEPGSRHALQEALERMLASQPLRVSLGRAGYELVSRQFGVRTMTESYLDLYEDVLHHRGRKQSPQLLPCDTQ